MSIADFSGGLALDLHPLLPRFTPLIQFPAIRVDRSAFVVLLPVNRQALFFFPAAHCANAAVQIQCDFFPGFQAVPWRDYFELGSRVQSLLYTLFPSGFPHAIPMKKTKFEGDIRGHVLHDFSFPLLNQGDGRKIEATPDA